MVIIRVIDEERRKEWSTFLIRKGIGTDNRRKEHLRNEIQTELLN